MRIDEKKKSKKKGMWYYVNKNKKEGKPPKRPGQKGYPSKKAWEKLTGKNEAVVGTLRTLIKETLHEMGIPAPLAWGRDLPQSDDPNDPYAGKMAWEIEYFEEFEKWPEVETPDWSAREDSDEQDFTETSGGMDRPLSSIR